MSVRETDALFTDFYELTMAQAFHAEGMNGIAVFELFFRKLPDERNYIIACGIEAALEFLESWHFDAEDIAHVASLDKFSPDFLQFLKTLRFSGDVHAVPEGTAVFGNEPVLQITAPLIEAQLVETWLLNRIHYASLVASKAARVVDAAAGRPVVDFGARRAHGEDAAMEAARAGYVTGLAGTSNVAAGCRYGIPLYGTMAHSYVQAHANEAAAFTAFTRHFPDTTVLVDTYDTLNGVREVVRLAEKLGPGRSIGAIRIDSGDLASLAHEARALLDDAGLGDIRIVVSGGLDEYSVQKLVRDAPIDAFGVGTGLVVSADRPSIDCAYKLVEYAGTPRLKLSEAKALWPGRKQVFRRGGATFTADTLALPGENIDGTPLLVPVVRGGRRLGVKPSLGDQREHCRQQLAALPASLRCLDRAADQYPVDISSGLQAMRERCMDGVAHAG
jgi:nicotinate phosphoribosyltransferase